MRFLEAVVARIFEAKGNLQVGRLARPYFIWTVVGHVLPAFPSWHSHTAQSNRWVILR